MTSCGDADGVGFSMLSFVVDDDDDDDRERATIGSLEQRMTFPSTMIQMWMPDMDERVQERMRDPPTTTGERASKPPHRRERVSERDGGSPSDVVIVESTTFVARVSRGEDYIRRRTADSVVDGDSSRAIDRLTHDLSPTYDAGGKENSDKRSSDTSTFNLHHNKHESPSRS